MECCFPPHYSHQVCVQYPPQQTEIFPPQQTVCEPFLPLIVCEPKCGSLWRHSVRVLMTLLHTVHKLLLLIPL